MTDSLFKTNKNTKDLEKKLNSYYKKDDGIKFKEWLDSLKDSSNIINGKIPGLLNTSKITLETTSETGTYNLILTWILENKDKFSDYDFKGIPSSSFINIENDIKKDKSNVKKNEFKTDEDVKRWCEEPNIHPISSEPLNPMGAKYHKIWRKAFYILKKKYGNNHIKILDTLPARHILFFRLDFLYYTETKLSNVFTTDSTVQNTAPAIFRILTENLEEFDEKETKIETEYKILENLYSKTNSNYDRIELKYRNYCNNFCRALIDPSKGFDYEKHDLQYLMRNYDLDHNMMGFIYFLRNYKFSNAVIILDQLNQEAVKPGCPDWIKDCLKLHSNYESCMNDIRELLSENSTIVENKENKKFELLEDPLDKYFKKYEDSLDILKNEKYKRLIDINTLKPIDKKNYLNDKENSDFEKEFKSKDSENKKNIALYETKYKEYETIKRTNPNAKSPSPPKQRFTIKLPNGTTYINGQKKPLHIKDSIVKSFNKEYDKSKELIEEYAKVKNMSYYNLIKFMEKKSPTKQIKDNIKDNKLLSMSRQEINDKILYDEYVEESELADRCNDSNDILTKDDFDSSDYPLSKLQLLVRLKIYNNDKYKTECIYAPALYNYLIECINTKKPFINPITRVTYTEEHINELMKVMRIINPDIETPYLLKPIRDTKLKITYRPIGNKVYEEGFNIEFYSIYIIRHFGNYKFKVYDLCTIPANIEPTGEFATNSNDISSTTMLFRIHKLFEDGRLLEKYVPPYAIETGGYYRYLKIMIHFNRFKTMDHWIFEGRRMKTKKEVVDMFIRYAQEINNYIYD